MTTHQSILEAQSNISDKGILSKVVRLKHHYLDPQAAIG